MSCLDCPALPTFLQEAGRLFLWLPTPHTHRKIWQALEAKTEVPVQLLEDLGLVVAIAQGALKKTLETMAEVLSQEEMQASRALFLPGDRDPCWQDCARVESLLQLFHRTQAELLLELLKENRLTTYFQPIVRARDPAWVVGHEALVRGLDREGKVIGPDLLFATAREAGLLYHLDLAARRTAIAAATQHRLEGDLFINFSPTAIYDPAFCLRSTVWAISRAGIPPERVVFEVNESDRSPDLDHLQRILRFYRQAGFRVALDDLGAGYGSLNLLHRLQPDVIKLDRELIRGVDGDPYKAVIAQKVLELAQELGIVTLAEGIETAEELQWVRDHGVDLVQGFFIARPQPVPPGLGSIG
ncbi:diguanylate cyclase [Synechococcus sp. 60AY4M2]|jgi:EAL domain-containing protein (putative c-di-GMP-specific phosphodiesterase class I)|uniref:EAL domain-containing protein n=1 Tax=unclassified Synechococcus TaxID=2626047 RepID=UPI000C18D623|nr:MULTISPECIES: EAL domain-containing protein [unclassified Synechococcus]PIK88601.1 diguanylate cyclase [Synechococcus sp. 65AY6A5]PIK94391.1 diguanylate cyclase [Synechococcus sp. 60AY4M2]PIK96649.1 diguanylate cyclase [Synechococcus sp. 63AY4M1]PIL00312.1 diguanylate cyclase [Synechococcus sp. 65AY640]